MKVFYTTDLHGMKNKFEAIPDLIEDHELLIIGADILPKNMNNIHMQQRSFLVKYLPRFFSKIDIPIIIDFGNDDHMSLYSMFVDLVDRHFKVSYSHGKVLRLHGLVIAGMHFVPDYPFGLKDWCRSDCGRMIDPNQFTMRPVTSKENGYNHIEDLYEYLKSHSSMEDHLSDFTYLPIDILLAHAPPRGLGLDVCANRQKVGSEAVTRFIMDYKPKITLHGHIHESPYISGVSLGYLRAESASIQPGQGGLGELVYCEFDTDNVFDSFDRKVIDV